MEFSMLTVTKDNGEPQLVWSTEKVARLRALYEFTEYSFGQMATMMSAEFDAPISRNALIGKINRLGIRHLRLTTRIGKVGRPYAKQPNRPRVTAAAVSLKRAEAMRPKADASESSIKRPQGRQPGQSSAPSSMLSIVPNRYNTRPALVTCDPIELLELDKGRCKWPLGEMNDPPPYQYCGGATTSGCSYCGRHTMIAFARRAEKAPGAKTFIPPRSYRR